jgi:hypothetical protein
LTPWEQFEKRSKKEEARKKERKNERTGERKGLTLTGLLMEGLSAKSELWLIVAEWMHLLGRSLQFSLQSD